MSNLDALVDAFRDAGLKKVRSDVLCAVSAPNTAGAAKTRIQKAAAAMVAFMAAIQKNPNPETRNPKTLNPKP